MFNTDLVKVFNNNIDWDFVGKFFNSWGRKRRVARSLKKIVNLTRISYGRRTSRKDEKSLKYVFLYAILKP